MPEEVRLVAIVQQVAARAVEGTDADACGRGTKKNPLDFSKGFVLRETHHNSNFLLLRIPLEIHNSRRGQKAFSIADRYLPSALPLSQAAITRLRQHSLIREPQPTLEKRPTIDYEAPRKT